MSFCSNAVIHVEIQNEGEDAFKPDIYGDVIIVERRISESASSITLKDHQGAWTTINFQDIYVICWPIETMEKLQGYSSRFNILHFICARYII